MSGIKDGFKAVDSGLKKVLLPVAIQILQNLLFHVVLGFKIVGIFLEKGPPFILMPLKQLTFSFATQRHLP